MLLKLFKHELRFIIKEFLIASAIFNALVFLSILFLRIGFEVNSGIMMTTSLLALYLLFILAIIYTFRLIFKSISSNIFSNEGYLTLMLPVKTQTLILAKILAGFVLIFCFYVSFAVAVVIILSFLQDSFNIFLGSALTFELVDFFNFMLDLFINSIHIVLVVLFCLSIFYTFKKRNNKIIKLISLFFVIMIAQSFINNGIAGVLSIPNISRYLTICYSIAFYYLSYYLIENKIDLFQ